MSKGQTALNIIVTARGLAVNERLRDEIARCSEMKPAQLSRYLGEVMEGRRSPWMENTALKIVQKLPRGVVITVRAAIKKAEPNGGAMTKLFAEMHPLSASLVAHPQGESNTSSEVHQLRTIDNLRRIRGIDAVVEGALNRHGVWRYAQIAAWTAADIASMGKVFELNGRFDSQSWIQQARILARGGATAFSRKEDARAAEVSAYQASVLEHP